MLPFGRWCAAKRQRELVVVRCSADNVKLRTHSTPIFPGVNCLCLFLVNNMDIFAILCYNTIHVPRNKNVTS